MDTKDVLNSLSGTDKSIFFNCTITNVYPVIKVKEPQFEITEGAEMDELIDENHTEELVDFIKNKLGLTIPENIIKEILNAETDYYMNGEDDND